MHGTLGDIWIFNTGDRTWITPVVEGKPPCPREVHTGTMVTDGRLLVFGGRSPAGQVPSLSSLMRPVTRASAFADSSAGCHPRMIANAGACMYLRFETLLTGWKPLAFLTI